jgi:undecaprenyl-diphosphatase
MTVWHAFVLGIVQGLAEFLPISSSAHLVLVPWAFGWPDPGLAFDVALHAGTLVALLWYFRAEWARLLRAAFRVARDHSLRGPEEQRLAYLVIGTIPGGIAGLLLEHKADEAFRAPILIAFALIVMGILLWLVDRANLALRTMADLRWHDAVIVGVAQVFALIPGVSRSGATITAARSRGFTRESAAEFSFLLSMPIIAAAALLKLPRLLEHGITTPVAVGVAAAAVSSWLAIRFVLAYVRGHSYGVFAAYRVLLGVAVIALVVYRGRHG